MPLVTSCSLFHRKRARSATWKCVLPTHLARVRKRVRATGSTCSGPASSSTSSSSLSSVICLAEEDSGQERTSPRMTVWQVAGSFSTYCDTQ